MKDVRNVNALRKVSLAPMLLSKYLHFLLSPLFEIKPDDFFDPIEKVIESKSWSISENKKLQAIEDKILFNRHNYKLTNTCLHSPKES